MELRDRQATYRGFSNALGQAVEMVVTPLLFALFGYWLDGVFDIRPVLTIAFAAIGVVGMALRTYYWYQAEIAREEEGKPWTRSPR